MQFHPNPERNAFPTSGYPFLAEGSEDKKHIDAEQDKLLAPKPKNDRSGKRRTRHHTAAQRETREVTE